MKGIGAKKEYLDATIRFSMSEMTTKEEMDYTLEALQELGADASEDIRDIDRERRRRYNDEAFQTFLIKIRRDWN